MFDLEKREKRTEMIGFKISEAEKKKLAWLFQRYKLFTEDATVSNMMRRLILRVYSEKRKSG